MMMKLVSPLPLHLGHTIKINGYLGTEHVYEHEEWILKLRAKILLQEECSSCQYCQSNDVHLRRQSGWCGARLRTLGAIPSSVFVPLIPCLYLLVAQVDCTDLTTLPSQPLPIKPPVLHNNDEGHVQTVAQSLTVTWHLAPVMQGEMCRITNDETPGHCDPPQSCDCVSAQVEHL
ncbi:hypothetical protein Bbelb_207220 [Branchiostoma belcheri]|nr:hypothetical protein Bbelb_207220 [Branchiostoma belcheri]